MFQVILLALMGSNNSAREIAGERLIFEKEKFSGLSPLAYVFSKVAFLGVLVAVQSIWMASSSISSSAFPARSATASGCCSAPMPPSRSSASASPPPCAPEQASLVSIYLVGFQLPLSGAVLALPSGLNFLTRPLIASYWGWSGFIQTMRDTRFYEAIGIVTQTSLSAYPLCLWVLVCHCLVRHLHRPRRLPPRAVGVRLAQAERKGIFSS